MDMRVPARRRHQRPRRRARRAGLDAATTRPTRGSRTTATTTRSPIGSACAGWPRRRCARRAARSSARWRSRRRRRASSTPEELDLLQGLADQAAIAITNSTLLTRLTESEERYRYLVENAPDLVWSIGADTRLTFVSDAVERLTGFRPDELIGRHFGALVHESSREVAEFDWAAGMAQRVAGAPRPGQPAGPRRSPIPAEFIATARLDETGAFVGANGSVRDIEINVVGSMRDGALSAIHGVARDVSERERLERELHESEARFRQLVQTSPDVIYRCDAEGRFVFMAEGSEALFGWTPAEVGRDDLRRPHRRGVARRGAGQLRAAEDRARRRPPLPLPRQVPRRDDVPGRDHLGLGLGGRPVRRRPGHGPRRHHSRSASSASCASRRSATGSSSRTRRTSSSRPTPRASSPSCPNRWSG